ncbi:hypothetical protein Tco_1414995 [Tanacetum coccineum]
MMNRYCTMACKAYRICAGSCMIMALNSDNSYLRDILGDILGKDMHYPFTHDYTVVNNSVFRAFFEKQILTGPNFIDWYRNLRIVLSVEDKLPFLEHPIHAMPIPPAGQVLPPDVLATHAAWVKASKEIVGLVLMTMEPDIQKNLE